MLVVALPRWGWMAADACGAEPVKAAIISPDATRTALSISMPLTVSLARSVRVTRVKAPIRRRHGDFFSRGDRRVHDHGYGPDPSVGCAAWTDGRPADGRQQLAGNAEEKRGDAYERAVAPNFPLFAAGAGFSPRAGLDDCGPQTALAAGRAGTRRAGASDGVSDL